jgi:hypothetical protein
MKVGKAKSLHERICDIQREVPDTPRPFEPRVIWTRHKAFYPKSCDSFAVMEGDCQHPEGWHRIPYRVRTDLPRPGYVFEVKRRRPDGEPGTEWTPMKPSEIKWVERQWIVDRIVQLICQPEIEDTDD